MILMTKIVRVVYKHTFAILQPTLNLIKTWKNQDFL